MWNLSSGIVRCVMLGSDEFFYLVFDFRVFVWCDGLAWYIFFYDVWDLILGLLHSSVCLLLLRTSVLVYDVSCGAWMIFPGP